MAEEPEVRSIRDRINAFQVAGTTTHLGRAPVTANKAASRTTVDKPSLDHRSHSVNSPPTLRARSDQNAVGNEPNAPKREGVLPPPTNIVRTGQDSRVSPQVKPTPPPRLPPRRQATQPSPALPPRRPSDQLDRKISDESISSTVSSISNIPNGVLSPPALRRTSTESNRIKAPLYDPATLPSLPSKRSTETQRPVELANGRVSSVLKSAEQRKLPPLHSKHSSPSVITREVEPEPMNTPCLPVRRPSELDQPQLPARRPQSKPPPKPPRSALSFGMNKVVANGEEGSRDLSEAKLPPPIPHSSRPDISKLLATKPSHRPSSSGSSVCLLCRDFSAIDAHAAKFPRQGVPSLDWLAQQLTDPFPSLTDKARSIFTWLHHNISYDTVSFFNGTVKPSTPATTLQSGLAVCEGYAGLFTALASKVGLESVVVGGHGKGFGFASLPPGAAIPAEDPGGHAWNAVKIDGGYWKLIDCCWGAGHISGQGQAYTRKFSPRMFTMPNQEFGLRHYPQNRGQFFVQADGICPPSWQEYYLGPLGGQEALQVYSGVAESEGISETSFLPRQSRVAVSPSAHAGPMVRFQFSQICEHWDSVKNGHGPPYVFILAIKGVDGRQNDYVPFETDGQNWWLDIEPQRLGCAGQTISAYTVETVDGQSGRGLGIEGYRQAKGRKGMGFGGLAAWKLV